LIVTVSFAIGTLRVGPYKFMYPSPGDVFLLAEKTSIFVRRERAASLFRSFVNNQEIVDRKATYLIGAQLWFRNSIFLSLTLAMLLTGYVSIRNIAERRASPTFPQPTSTIASPTLVDQTETGQPSVSPTETFSPTREAPTPTATSTLASIEVTDQGP
jgi:hypothetical protein